MNKTHDKVLWITQTAVLVALLITLQWVTGGTSAFAGQYITGSCVNAVLATAVLFAGMWSGVTVAVLSPFFAFLLGIGPKLFQLVPAIALGNLSYVLMLYFLIGKRSAKFWVKLIGLVLAAAVKFAVLNLLIVHLMLPLLMIPEKQAAVFTVMFSYPQMITALIGGVLALLIVPVLKKAFKRS